MLSKLAGIIRGKLGPLRVIGLGDSIMANDSYLSPGTNLWTEGNGFFERALRTLNGDYYNYVFVSNAGVPGNTVAQMLARVDTDVIALHPDVCFLMAGTNDILPGATDADYATFFNTLEKLIVKLLLAGIDVRLYTMPAKDAAPTEVAHIMPWYYLLAKHYGLELIDAYRATVDPVTGTYKSGYSDDGTHPNQTGIAAIPVYSTPQSYRAAVAQTSVGGAPNMFINGNFVNQSFPPNIDGWDVNTSDATYTVDTDASIVGKVFDYVKTAAGGVYSLYGTGIDSGFDDGDVLVFSGVLGVTGLPSPADGFTFLMQFDGGDSFRPFNTHTDNIYGAGPDNMVAFTMEAVVPAGYAGNFPIIPQWYVQDVGTYKAAEMTLWNKTKYEAVYKPGSLLNM